MDGFLEWRNRFFKSRDVVVVDFHMEERRQILEDTMGSITERQKFSSTEARITEENRIIRDSALSRFLKMLYEFQCQICLLSFKLPSGASYSESHHVRPLGGGHAGLDIESNMLVLCPNHHAMMDYGVIAIHPESLAIVSIDDRVLHSGRRLEVTKHPVKPEFLEYHLTNVFNRVH